MYNKLLERKSSLEDKVNKVFHISLFGQDLN